MRHRRWIFALTAVVLLLAVALLAAPSWIRTRAVDAARGRGVELTVGSVRLGWFRVELRDITARPEGMNEVSARASAISARVGAAGASDLSVEGLVVDANGDVAALKASFDAWKARHPSPTSSGSGSGRSYTLRDVWARWHLGALEPASVHVREASLHPTKLEVHGADLTLHVPAGELRANGIDSELSRPDGRLGSTNVASIALELQGKGGFALPLEPADAPAEAPTPARADAWQWVTRARAAMQKVLARFESGVELKVGELTVITALPNEERRTLGPWSSRVVMGTDAIAFELDPGEKAGRKPLVMRGLVPRERGKWTAELKMGPATLSELGIAEGAFGLTEVATASVEARGSVELDPEEKTFAADGSINLKGASINDARLADGVVKGIDVGGRGVLASKGDLSAWTLTGGAIELGKVRFEIEGGVEAVEVPKEGKRGPRLWASWSVPIVPCNDALHSMPQGLLPRLEGMEMQGTFGARGRVGFDARFPEKTEVDLFLEQKCRVTKAPPSISVEKFKEPFELRVYDPKGNPKVARFGPGTPEWVSYEKVSPYVIDALMTCEDGAFFVHNGFSAGAIRNAIIANIKAGKFALGASTISMQLAKNVFLDRRKQLSRKLQEAVLTAWLEQAMSKSEMLELYLNVIEFGPNLYGIGPAAHHWFGRSASDLDPAEATFLISILPAPVRRHAMWDRGEPGDGYLQYLRTLLKEEHRRGKLDDDEYQNAIKTPLKFHKPGEPPPPPHGITAAKVDTANGDDSAFDPGGLSPPAD